MVSKKRKVITTLVMLPTVAGLTLLVLETTGTTTLTNRLKNNEKNSLEEQEATTTSDTPTAQPSFSEGEEREPGNSLNENRGNSVILDTGGSLPANTDTSQPTKSATGEITVYSPAKNAQIKKGHLIAGSSSLPKITYRVIDDISGMIAMGELTVSNGRFSGTIDFETSSKNGRIDIFATRADGSEYSTVEIPITFR